MALISEGIQFAATQASLREDTYGAESDRLLEMKARLKEETALFFRDADVIQIINVDGTLSPDTKARLEKLFHSYINAEKLHNTILKTQGRNIGHEEIQTIFERAQAYLGETRQNPDVFIAAINYMAEEAVKVFSQNREDKVEKLRPRYAHPLTPLAETFMGKDWSLQKISTYHEVNNEFIDHLTKINKICERLDAFSRNRSTVQTSSSSEL